MQVTQTFLNTVNTANEKYFELHKTHVVFLINKFEDIQNENNNVWKSSELNQ